MECFVFCAQNAPFGGRDPDRLSNDSDAQTRVRPASMLPGTWRGPTRIMFFCDRCRPMACEAVRSRAIAPHLRGCLKTRTFGGIGVSVSACLPLLPAH